MAQQAEHFREVHHPSPAHGHSTAHDPLANIAVLAVKFVENVKTRFGEQADETNVVFTALGRFRYGEISKRDTLSIISGTLGSHYDLKHDLMNVLNHQAAQWAPEDFDQLPVHLSAPQFLQPVHQPQMRMPPLFAPWDSRDQSLPALGPPLTNDLSHFERFEPDGRKLSLPSLDSPFTSPTFYNATPVQLTSPALRQVHDVSPHEPTFDGVLPSLELGNISQGSQFAPHSENIDYANTWDEEGTPHDFQHEQHLEETKAISPDGSLNFQHLENPRLHRRSESVTAISPHQLEATFPPVPTSNPCMLSEHTTTAIGQTAVDMPPPPRKRSRKPSSVTSKVEEQHGKDDTRQGYEGIQDQQSTGPTASRKNSENGGRFVHGICGKSFAKRHNVKKHHWGNKIGDVNTTTGCWYRNKNKTPSANWDDHPSCKEAPSRAKEPSLPAAKPSQTRTLSIDNKAPTVPSMDHSPGTILPGLPDVQDFSDYVRPGHAPSNHGDGVYRLPYHNHGFPATASSSPFENLLTVVNLAANIESPVPKGRNDSVVFSNLDAEAMAVEHADQFAHDCAFSSAGQASYFDPVFDQHQTRSSVSRPAAYDNATEQEW